MSNPIESAHVYQVLTKHLAKVEYSFICPSPETQERVVRQRVRDASTAYAKNATDFFGWNLQCTRIVLMSIIPDTVFEDLYKADIVVRSEDDKYWSGIRVSNFYLPKLPDTKASIVPLYYIHSSFPTSSDSVFFGPDTYNFISFLQSSAQHLRQAPASIIDVCCGSGAGAIQLARMHPHAKVVGLDLNPNALKLGYVNAQLAGVTIDFHESNLYTKTPEIFQGRSVDLIVSNPPYIASSEDREDLPIYADGGAEIGSDISLRIVEEGLKIISSSGVIMLYTGVAILTSKPGGDAFLERLKSMEGVELVQYTILNPDMWSEEIGRGAYAEVGRIQVVGAVLRKVRRDSFAS